MKHKKGERTLSQRIILGIFIVLALAALVIVFVQISATGFAIFGTNNAAFISQDVPSSMNAGQNYTITIVMNNTGTNPWTTLGKYRLGSKSPQSNTIWGTNRVELPSSPVNKGKAASFTFPIKAPTTPGNYTFQWGMVQENKEWFGTPTQALIIQVKTVNICGDGLCGTEEQCEWNGTSQSQFKCPDSPIPTGQSCSGCMLYTTQKSMHVGSGIRVEGQAVILENVGSAGDIVINVEGIRETISKDAEEIVGCVLVKNINTYYVDNKSQRQALIDASPADLPPGTGCQATYPPTTPSLTVGEAIHFKGKEIIMDNVGSGGQAVISINGTQETLSLNTPEVINGLTVTLLNTTYVDQTSQRKASIEVVGAIKSGPGPTFSSCYPNQFTTTPALLSNVHVIVGQNAPSSDTFAALDVYSNLQYSLADPCSGVVPSVPEPIFLTDAEVTNPELYNLIIVGTEGSNTLIPQYRITSNYPYASIQFARNGDNAALLVIGKTTTATRDAAIALSQLNTASFNTNILCVSENKTVYACN